VQEQTTKQPTNQTKQTSKQTNRTFTSLEWHFNQCMVHNVKHSQQLSTSTHQRAWITKHNSLAATQIIPIIHDALQQAVPMRQFHSTKPILMGILAWIERMPSIAVVLVHLSSSKMI
jgi:hypothetical protein